MNKRSGLIRCAAVIGTTVALMGCSKPPPGVARLPATPAAVANVSDIDVTEHVKTALDRNEALLRFDIKVVTLKGDVRLIGALDTQAQIEQAVQIARAADGAHSVHDELTLKK
jgi:osmotically-inducible protein OsmY